MNIITTYIRLLMPEGWTPVWDNNLAKNIIHFIIRMTSSAECPIILKANHKKLLHLLPHKWKIQLPKSVLAKHRIRQLMPAATYSFNKTIATATIRFIVTATIVVH